MGRLTGSAVCGAGKAAPGACGGAGLTTSPRCPNFLTVGNQVNLFQLGIEKAIVVLIMTFVIISGEIDLSVASMMGLSAAVTAAALRIGLDMALGGRSSRSRWARFRVINGFFVAKVGFNSLAVTLAGYIGFRGLAQVCSSRTTRCGEFPSWFNDLGQHGLIGPITFSIMHLLRPRDHRHRRPALQRVGTTDLRDRQQQAQVARLLRRAPWRGRA